MREHCWDWINGNWQHLNKAFIQSALKGIWHLFMDTLTQKSVCQRACWVFPAWTISWSQPSEEEKRRETSNLLLFDIFWYWDRNTPWKDHQSITGHTCTHVCSHAHTCTHMARADLQTLIKLMCMFLDMWGETGENLHRHWGKLHFPELQ